MRFLHYILTYKNNANTFYTLEKERKDIIKGAKQEASIILSETNAKIENTIRQIKEVQAEKVRTKAIREEMRKFKEEISDKENETSKLSKKIERINKNNKKKKGRKKGRNLCSRQTWRTPP